MLALIFQAKLFAPPLQEAVNRLALMDLRILTEVLQSGKASGELVFSSPEEDVAMIVASAIKGAQMLNRMPPHDACTRTIRALEQLLCRT